MRLIRFFPCLAVIVSFMPQAVFAQLPPQDPAYRLVFFDEFDSIYPQSGINGNIWDKTPGWNQASNKTGNVSYCYGSDTTARYWDRAYIIGNKSDTTTVKVSGGTCRLITRKGSHTGEIWTWPGGEWKISTLPFKYTTGGLFSRKLFRYGYFELRFRLPPAPRDGMTYSGFGPNFWLFGSDKAHNIHYSEIDIFEMDATDNTLTNNAHYANKPGVAATSSMHEHHRKLEPGRWYTASLLWTPDFLKFYLDGRRLNRHRSAWAGLKPDSLAAMNIFIDINAPASNFCRNFTDSTQFPYVYEIDYVRVFQLSGPYKPRLPWWKRLFIRERPGDADVRPASGRKAS